MHGPSPPPTPKHEKPHTCYLLLFFTSLCTCHSTLFLQYILHPSPHLTTVHNTPTLNASHHPSSQPHPFTTTFTIHLLAYHHLISHYSSSYLHLLHAAFTTHPHHNISCALTSLCIFLRSNPHKRLLLPQNTLLHLLLPPPPPPLTFPSPPVPPPPSPSLPSH